MARGKNATAKLEKANERGLRFVFNREFKKPRRRRRGQRRLKNELYLSYEYRDILKSFSLFLSVKTISKLNLEHSDKFEIEI